jgi:ribosomal protein S18 acetylase RimI-like enzyme
VTGADGLAIVDCDDFPLARELFREYLYATQEETGYPRPGDGIFEYLLTELDGLPGVYQPPDGALLLARVGDASAGSVGLARVDDTSVEMKRLWVRPHWRGVGVGRALTVACIDRARSLGYRRFVLDVVPTRAGAIALYESLGFAEIEPYDEYPFPMVFMARDLA